MFKLVITLSIVFIPLCQCINIDVFTVPPSSKEGSVARLECSANVNSGNLLLFIPIGRENGLIAWSKDGQLIAVADQKVNTLKNRTDVILSANRRTISGLDKNNILIETAIVFQSVQKTDAGVYECGLYESDPRNGSSKALAARDGMLEVFYYPLEPFPLCQPRTVRYDLRYQRPVTLKCTSEIGNPSVQLFWSKTIKDQEASLFGIDRQENDTISSELTLNGTVLDDQNSVFTCTIVSESFSESESSCSVTVNVVSPFRVSIYPNEVRTFVGETADFRCRVVHKGMYGHSGEDNDSSSREDKDSTEIQWSTDPRMLNSSRIIIVNNTLQVKDVQESENGTVISCYALFQDRWFEATSILYIYTLDQSSSGAQGFSTSCAAATAWVLSFFISGVLLLITLVILIWVIFKYRNLKQIQSAHFPNLERKPIESESQQQAEYRELRVQSVASPTYTDLKTRTDDQVTDAENNEDYTYVDEPNDRETRPVSTEELYDYADETEINQEGPRQPEYVNKPFKPNPVV